MLRKILCFIGWHEFRWSLGSDPDWIARGELKQDGKIPSHAKCNYCGKVYGRTVNSCEKTRKSPAGKD